MAHATVEWTANLDREFDLQGLLQLIAHDMRENSQGVFPVGGIRIRGIRLTDYVIADGLGQDDGFINIDVKMGAGRSAEFRKAYFDALFSRIRDHLGDLFDRRPLALSLYVEEAEGWKHNTIHDRIRTMA
jgi:5-carboxymethyl-2-hydroxymuconate isomerase